jgi:peptide/nickel transport system permease protein
MKMFLLRRLGALLGLLLAATFVTQWLLLASPGSYLSVLESDPQISPRVLALVKTQYGLESENVWVRHGRWLAEAARGNFGYSFKYHMPVWSLVWERLGATLLLTGTALLFAWGLAVPAGALAAAERRAWGDRAIRLVAAVGLATPPALLALLLVLLAARTGWFPTGGLHDPIRWDEFSGLRKAADVLWHLALPALVLALGGFAQTVRQARAEVLESLGQDFIRTALAKGLSWRQTVFRHALPPALNPLVTLFGFSLAYLLTGAVLIEQVFAWPGLGRLLVEALLAKDEPLVMASVMLFTLTLTAGNLIADLLLAYLNPQIRDERRGAG